MQKTNVSKANYQKLSFFVSFALRNVTQFKVVASRGILRRSSYGRTADGPAKGGRHIGFHCYVVYCVSGTYRDQ